MIKRDAPIPPVVKWLFGPLLLAVGGLELAVASGWIGLDASRLHAPLWLLGATGVSFVSIGLVLLMDGIEALERVKGWLAFVFLVSFTSIFNWVAFGPGERHFTTSSSVGVGPVGVSSASSGHELGGRIAFGIFAVLLDLLIASPLILGLWRWMRSSGSRGR
jgi:hypothetical protein